jgi:cell division protein FtsN
MQASDESASASTATNDADNMSADSTGPGTLAQVTDTTTESADRMPAGDEPARASTAANGADNIGTPSAEPASSIAEQTRPAADVEELARLEPAGIAAPEPASNAPLADIVRPGSTGRWVINLASYAGPKTAYRMQRKFEDLGVSTEKQVAEVNGKTMYRLRIASFESRADAEAYFETIKGALGLESAWITKK